MQFEKRLYFAAASVMLSVCLTGCSSGPGEADIKQAMRNNPKLLVQLSMLAQANSALGGPTETDPIKLIDAVKVERGNCVQAAGASGLVCDFRIAAGGQAQFGPWAKARFFQANGSWQMEQ